MRTPLQIHTKIYCKQSKLGRITIVTYRKNEFLIGAKNASYIVIYILIFVRFGLKSS